MQPGWVNTNFIMCYTPTVLVLLLLATNASAWSNGGWSADSSVPDYGTHDFIANTAFSYLSQEEGDYIVHNQTAYLFGTELPDHGDVRPGYDTSKHHIYFNADGSMYDNASAKRAQEEYNFSKEYFIAGDYENASIHLGMMTHYIADVGVFAHVMGTSTPWGDEVHHSDYEDNVTNHEGWFSGYVAFDGVLTNISAYNATMGLARIATFGNGVALKNCTWMDTNYDWSSSDFLASVRTTLNTTINTVADVLETFYSDVSTLQTETNNTTVPILPEPPLFTTMAPSPYSGLNYTVYWTIVANASGYNLKENGTEIYNGSAAHFLFMNKSNGNYTYFVRSWNQNGTSNWSEELPITVYVPPESPSQNTTSNQTNNTQGGADVDFTVLTRDVGTTQPLYDVAWNPDGRCALITGGSGTVVKYDGTNFSIITPPNSNGSLECVAWKQNGECALMVGRYPSANESQPEDARILKYNGSTVSTVLEGSYPALFGVGWRSDGSYAIIVGVSGTILKCDGTTVIRVNTSVSGNLLAVSWKPGGDYCLIVGDSGTALKYNGTVITQISTGTSSRLRAVAWSTDGRAAMVCGDGGTLLKFDGNNFTSIQNSVTGWLGDVSWRTGADEAVAVGSVGTVIDYFDGQVTFLANRTTPFNTTKSLRGISWKPSTDNVIIVGFDGTVIECTVAERTPNSNITQNATNHAPVIHSFRSNATGIHANSIVSLSVNATDDDNDTLSYSYYYQNGVISGSGATVTWMAPANIGFYAITVAVSDGKNASAATLTINVSSASATIYVNDTNTTTNNTNLGANNTNTTTNNTNATTSGTNATANNTQNGTNNTAPQGTGQNTSQNESAAKAAEKGFVPGFESTAPLFLLAAYAIFSRKRR